ncbi:MAG: hypothetical protein ACK4FR_02355 [Tabrizicola sp.]
MAGPLSSEEIEDVVSSVRRLVSNELRPRTLSRDLSADRLLLTAALRVVPESSPLAPLVLDAPVVEAPFDADSLTGNMVPGDASHLPPGDTGGTEPDAVSGDLVAEPTAAPAEQLSAVEPDLPPILPDPQAETEPAAAPFAEGLDSAAATEVAGFGDLPDESEAVWENGLWSEPDPVPLGELSLAVEEAEVLVGATGAEPPADAGMADAAPSHDWDQAEDAGTDPDEPVPFVPVHRRAEQLAARQASAEAALHEQASQPGGAADSAAAPEPEPGSEPTEFVDVDGMPLAVLDEAALQEIVRQTLRSELQGELGERITRNIRKLVRAEINRAFLARDLD